jgi:hypothetical protein
MVSQRSTGTAKRNRNRGARSWFDGESGMTLDDIKV